MTTTLLNLKMTKILVLNNIKKEVITMNDWDIKTKRNAEEMNVFSDNGAKREIKKGKGRMDLIPLDVLKRIKEKYNNIVNRFGVDEPILINKRDIEDTLIEQDYLKTIIYITCFQYAKYIPEGNISEFYSVLPLMLIDLSKQFEKGAEVYGERNCQMGLPNKSFIDSGLRHTYQWIAGQTDECHHISAIWNLWMYDWNTHNEPLKPKEITKNKSDYKCMAKNIIDPGFFIAMDESTDLTLPVLFMRCKCENKKSKDSCCYPEIDWDEVIKENKRFSEWITDYEYM